jgi:hypothetical protein
LFVDFRFITHLSTRRGQFLAVYWAWAVKNKEGTIKVGIGDTLYFEFPLGAFSGDIIMCRNIKTLHNFAPPATDEEIRASALQFVRKLSGFNRPSKANEAVFNRAIEDVTHAAHHLLAELVSNTPPRDRAAEAAKAKARNAARFGVAAR